jgi:hypothetical protein
MALLLLMLSVNMLAGTLALYANKDMPHDLSP